MRILFTGATGVLGQRAIPLLVQAGHEVTAAVRSFEGREWLSDLGVKPVVLDLFTRTAVSDVVAGHDAVFHFATSIPRHPETTRRSAWALNDRLRSEATALLVDASIKSDVHLFVQESVTFGYADGGDAWVDETSAIDPPWDVVESASGAEWHVSRFVASGGTGVSLRFSNLYGPGDVSAEQVMLAASRKLPIIGDGANYVSHIHIDDAARAIVAATHAPSGIYNVSGDVPVRSRENITLLTDEIGARGARRIPLWLARAAVGKAANILAVSQRVSNDKFKEATGWQPVHHSVREGWPTVVNADTVAAGIR